MNGIPSPKQKREIEQGMCETNKKCPKCGAPLEEYDGGDQGGASCLCCTECNYQKY